MTFIHIPANAAVFIDANFFIDIAPPFRIGLSYQNSNQTYADNQKVTNHRFEAAFYCVF